MVGPLEPVDNERDHSNSEEHMTQIIPSPVNSKTEPKSTNALIVALVGPPGSGKTALIEATARQLRGKLRLAVITVNPAAQRDAERIAHCCDYVQGVHSAVPSVAAILPALAKLPMDQIDLLFIESMGGLSGPPEFHQDLTVSVLSISGGDDKAVEYSDLLAKSSAVILSKAELRQHVLFDRNIFRSDLKSINSKAELFEISAFENMGMDQWIKWLLARYEEKHPTPFSAEYAQPDWFLG
jgi:hydrogenase nickel incorporation protein HypB